MTFPGIPDLQARWRAISTMARVGLIAGVLVILGGAAVLAWQVFAPRYQVLFSDLGAQDAAAIVAELDKMKLPHRIEDGGKTVLVEESEVHKTRLKLMSKGGVNLRGTVGFELFADNDFGMTEFAQKINYQRALQGELARTIMSLEEVRAARVHLVLPEAGLLRRNEGRGKASITITTQPGRQLNPAQVAGIQRLVAAAVPQVDPGAVTLLDSRGVALNPSTDSADGLSFAGGDARLDLKRQTETYFVQKATAVLDKAVGPGRAIVTVDVALNHDAVKVTQEQVLPGPGGREAAGEGALLRSRQTTQKELHPRAAGSAGTNEPAAATQQNESTSSEREYQHGKRIEQIVSAPGAIRRVSVGLVLPDALPEAQAQKLSEVVAMAVGLVPARGDGISTYTMHQLANGRAGDNMLSPALAPANVQQDEVTASRQASEPVDPSGMAGAAPGKPAQAAAHASESKPPQAIVRGVAVVLLACLAVMAWLWWRRQQRTPRLSAQDRAAMLRELNEWLAPSTGQGRRP